VKRVRAVLRDRDTGRVRGTLTVDAPYVVLAGGAVGTPALLQRSALGGGGVGRYLRLHPTTAVTGFYDREVAAGAGVPMSSICDEFTGAGANGYGYWIETPPVHPSLAGLASGFGRDHAARARLYPTTGTFVVLVRDGADPLASNGSVTVDRAGGRGCATGWATPTPATCARGSPRARGCTWRRARARRTRCTPTRWWCAARRTWRRCCGARWRPTT
jgi:hypothetical protein